MQKITFEDTTVIKKPYIELNGIEYELHDGEYQGGTDLNAQTFNQMQNNIEETINGIIKSGSNENGYWIKYADGTMLCWRNNYTTTVDITTSWGNLYAGIINDIISYPINFISTPTVNYEIIPTTATGFIKTYYDIPTIQKEYISNLCVARPSSITDVPVRIDYVAIGRWK